MGEIENETYLRPSEAHRRPLKHGPPLRLTMRKLIDEHLSEKRKLRGKDTTQNYLARLLPVLEFCELQHIRKRYPYAETIDRGFVVDLRAYLFDRRVARNGHPLTYLHRMSPRQIHNVLSTLAMVLNWAHRPDVNKLPLSFSNPLTSDVIGKLPAKDPLAPPKVPVELRIEMVNRADAWQLAAFALLFVLPPRPEDFAGLLVSDVLWPQRQMQFGIRMNGDDFNKGRQCYRAPFPPELDPIIGWLIGGRNEGPLIRRRSVLDGSRPACAKLTSEINLTHAYHRLLENAKTGEVQADQDRKRLFRRLLRQMGGASEDSLAREFQKVLARIDGTPGIRLYDCRGSITTDLLNAGVDKDLRLYLTGHSLRGEILAHYQSLDLERHLTGYFRHISPLLKAIATRASELGMSNPAPANQLKDVPIVPVPAVQAKSLDHTANHEGQS